MDAVRRVYQDGLALFSATGLHGAPKRVPKAGEPGFDDNSFEQYMRQNWQPHRFDSWWQDLKNCFSDHRLNYLRFEKKVMDVDASQHSIYPVANFVRAIDEIEHMATDTAYFHTYILTERPTIEWPEIKFDGQTVTQGLKSHTFENEDCIQLLNALWDDRETQLPDEKTVSRRGTVLPWTDPLNKSKDGTKATCQAINKPMREKGISLRVTYPKKAGGVVLIATEQPNLAN